MPTRLICADVQCADLSGLDFSEIPYSKYAPLHGRTTDDPADTASKQGTRVTPRQRLQHESRYPSHILQY